MLYRTQLSFRWWSIVAVTLEMANTVKPNTGTLDRICPKITPERRALTIPEGLASKAPNRPGNRCPQNYIGWGKRKLMQSLVPTHQPSKAPKNGALALTGVFDEASGYTGKGGLSRPLNQMSGTPMPCARHIPWKAETKTRFSNEMSFSWMSMFSSWRQLSAEIRGEIGQPSIQQSPSQAAYAPSSFPSSSQITGARPTPTPWDMLMQLAQESNCPALPITWKSSPQPPLRSASFFGGTSLCEEPLAPFLGSAAPFLRDFDFCQPLKLSVWLLAART